MTKQARQAWLLVGLLAVFGGVMTYQFWPSSETATGAVAPSNQKDATGGVPGTLQVATLDLDRLQNKPEAGAAQKRDPFRFKPKPLPPAPKPVVQQQPQIPVNPGPPPPPRDPRPAIALKYLGYAMSPGGVRIAVLQDNAHPPVFGKQGDVIDGKYRLLRVDANEVELSYLDGAQRRRIVKGQ
jgi:hypothetical protein